MSRRHVEISGAGFAGLTAAAAFAQRGWRVRVHERADDLRTAGAGIFLFENGLKVLQAIGAADDALRGANQVPGRETRDAHGRLVAHLPSSPSARIYTVVRQQLLEAVARAAVKAGAEIVTGSEAVAADPSGQLVLANGTRCPADLVVAADGVNSKIRDTLHLLNSRVALGDGAIRVLLPRQDEATSNTENVVEHWSGKRRLLYVPCGKDWLYLALTTLTRDAAGHALPLRVDEWRRSFPHLDALLHRIGERGRWDAFEVIRLHRWSSGKVAVVGDAAHAQAPNLGQGGGCAMMNALGLAVAVDQEHDVCRGLANWEARERPLTEHTQRISSLYGKVGNWPGALRNLAFAVAGRSQWMIRQRMRTAQHSPTGA